MGKNLNKKISGMFYMTTEERTAKEIREVLRAMEGIRTELWEDMNILQVELKNGNEIDFEPMKAEFKDASDNAFLKNRGVKTMFYLTMEESDFGEMKIVFQKILQEFQGFLCSDSDDFKPIFLLEDLQ